MAIDRLDHYSIRTTDLETTRKFYTEILGFEVGPRPDFPFPGLWLYRHGIAVVHVVGIDPKDSSGLKDYLGDEGTAEGTGIIDHVAFVGQDFEAVRDHFVAVAVPFRERKVPNMALMQLFVDDPNGVTIELNFPG